MTDSTDHDNTYTYVSDVNDHLICPICRQPFIDPAQTLCGHIFCSSCITQSLQSSQLCPIDRQTLVPDEVKPAPKIVAALVNELRVQCPRGCGKDVERGCLNGHLRGDCDLEDIECACGKTITRRDQRIVTDFEKSGNAQVGCIHEWIQCQDCSTTLQRLHKKDHQTTCPAQQSQCQHCQTLLPNSLLPTHFETCPSTPIPCPHVPLGCLSTSLPRSHLPSHLTTCPFVPLSPLLTSLLTRLSALETVPPPPPDPEIDRLRADLDVLNQVLGDLEMRFSGAVVAERIRMVEEVERLRGQVGALRREVWFTRRRDVGGVGPGAAGGAGGGAGGAAGVGEMTRSGSAAGELLPVRRLSGMFPVRKGVDAVDTSTKQIVKL